MSIDNARFPLLSECWAMIQAGALVVLNHSGGKDSQAMTILLSRIVPRAQLVAVHDGQPMCVWVVAAGPRRRQAERARLRLRRRRQPGSVRTRLAG